MSLNHFSTDLPETLWWAQQHHQQQQLKPIMEPNPKNNNSSSKPQNPHNSSWPPHLYHHYQGHQSWLNPYNPHEPSSMLPPQNPTLTFNLNQEESEEQDQELILPQQKQEPQQQEHEQEVHQQEIEKEPMFEKPLTPSDVGKLNRLVIPKQHAEKYFPLGGSGDSAVDKGLLLSFEDESGKCWRFRYSYWNSSQSYVLTKGWSRYVKEKQLDAGDVVLFQRHRIDSDRLFIGWRRRGESSSNSGGVMVHGSSGGVWSRGLYSSSSSVSTGHQPYHLATSSSVQHGHGANVSTGNVPYQPDCLHAGI